MHRKYVIELLIVLALIGPTACQPGQLPAAAPTSVPTAPPSPIAPSLTTTPALSSTAPPAPAVVDSLRTMLKYVSPQWDQPDSSSVLGQGLYYLDVAQIRRDLNIPPVTGEDESKAKSSLILGLNTQGLGSPLDCISPGAFKKWGWDIADVDQALIFRDDFTTVLHGNFGRPTIQERLREQGYQVAQRGDFTLFTKEAKSFTEVRQFAVKDDTLISGWNQGIVESLVERQRLNKPGLDQKTEMQPLLDQLSGSWAAFLAPRGDMNGYKDWVVYQSYLATDQSLSKDWLKERLDREPLGVWEIVAIGWKGKQPTQLQFVYRYPTRQDAADDVELVKQALTESPAIHYNLPWGKVLNFDQATAKDNLVIATVTTTKETLISRVIDNQEWGLLPIRFGSMPALPQITSGQTEATQSDAGWTLYSKESDGFSIELPSGWMTIDLNPQALEKSLEELRKKNPGMADLAMQQARDAARSGLKLMAVSLPGMADRQRFAIASVMKLPQPMQLPLESMAIEVRNQYEKLSDILGPIKYERLRLPAGDTRKFSLRLKFSTATGDNLEAAMIQYLLINGDYLYALNLYVVNDPEEKFAPVMQQIMEKFRFVK